MTIPTKEILIEAIKAFDNFNKSQKAVLALVIEFAEEDVANIAVRSIASMAGLSRTIIYKSLNALEELNLISREKVPQEKVGYIRINTGNFQRIIDFYEKKKQYIPKKVFNRKN